ncbi:2'-5' RNA ligase family protein [Parapedobacter sp. GCM10030251]|uniref:2'-5' RNA ligase family protein n=1 Tax=Parapedobacter sp. GCM10030251 TaxID=3273419 RepID=UPI0036147547
MATSLQPAFGLHLYEYLLIIEPIAEAQKQIRAFKEYFIKNHRYPNAIVSKGHITLMRFIQYDTYEKYIVRQLQGLAAATKPFDVELEGFGSFGHTIFVDVKSTDPIRQLISLRRAELRPFVNTKGFAPYFVSKPHITIARNLTPLQHEAIWPIWNRTRYHGSFQAKNMILLKRKAGTFSYSVAQKLNFLGISPKVTQGKLFA